MYVGGIQSKMITFVFSDNTKIKNTDNHEYYFEGDWQPARNIAERAMALCFKHQKPIPNIFDGKTYDNRLSWFKKTYDNEAGNRQIRLFKNFYYYKRKNKADKITQTCSSGIFREQRKQALRKSHRLQSFKQFIREFGVGYLERKRSTFFEKLKGIQKRTRTQKSYNWGERVELEVKRVSNTGDTSKIQSQSLYQKNVINRVRGERIDNKGYCSKKELDAFEIKINDIIEINFENSNEPVYDLCIEDNHNYLVTEKNIIVHNSGKSFLGCNLIFGDALMYPETHYFIAREALNDIRKFTIPSIHEVFNSWGLDPKYYKFNGQDNMFTMYNGSVVYLLEARYLPSDPQFMRFGSMQMTRGWIEEGGQVDEEAKNNLAASIGRWNNDKYGLHRKLLITCNPSKNFLYKNYKKFREGALEPHIKFLQALPTDNKMLNSGYLEHLNLTLSASEKERLLHGNWEYDDDPSALCDYEKLIELFTNKFDSLSQGQKYITADIARFGSDKIVIGLWHGFKVTVKTFTKQSITETAAYIEKLRTENNIPLSNVIVDEDGVGGGAKDIIKCKGFVNNSKALDGENYENLQAQCAFKLADRINVNGIYFECDDLKIQADTIEELEQLKRKNIDNDGKQGIVGKDHVKSIIGRSPDYRDMLLMREWFELKSNRSSGVFDYSFGAV